MDKEDQDINSLFRHLMSELDDDQSYPNHRPILAHYTSIENIESILKSGELWFSNPLFMNDTQELHYVANRFKSITLEHTGLKNSFDKASTYNRFTEIFNFYFERFEHEKAIDVYVFCLSEHDQNKPDGILSMWRGYAAEGNGAALVIDTNSFTKEEIDNYPIYLNKVIYLSNDKIENFIDNKISLLANSIKNIEISQDSEEETLTNIAWNYFQVIVIFSILIKHSGFSEENEWRLFYMPDLSTNNIIDSMCLYNFGKYGIEPKLKFNINELNQSLNINRPLDDYISNIILGPSLSGPRAVAVIKRMLDKLNLAHLKDKLSITTIPFRA